MGENAKTKFIKVRYEAIVELKEEVSGIEEDSPFKLAQTILSRGILSVMSPRTAEATLEVVHPATFRVGLHFSKEKKARKRSTPVCYTGVPLRKSQEGGGTDG